MRTFKALMICAMLLPIGIGAAWQGKKTASATSPTLEQKIAAAEKEGAAAKAALDAAEAKYRAELKNRQPDQAPPKDPFLERVRWMEADRKLSNFRFEKLQRDHSAFMTEYKKKMSELKVREVAATAKFCESSAKVLANPESTAETKAAIAQARNGLCK